MVSTRDNSAEDSGDQVRTQSEQDATDEVVRALERRIERIRAGQIRAFCFVDVVASADFINGTQSWAVSGAEFARLIGHLEIAKRHILSAWEDYAADQTATTPPIDDTGAQS